MSIDCCLFQLIHVRTALIKTYYYWDYIDDNRFRLFSIDIESLTSDSGHFQSTLNRCQVIPVIFHLTLNRCQVIPAIFHLTLNRCQVISVRFHLTLNRCRLIPVIFNLTLNRCRLIPVIFHLTLN